MQFYNGDAVSLSSTSSGAKRFLARKAMYETCLGQGKLVLFVPNAEYEASAMSKLTEYRSKVGYACFALNLWEGMQLASLIQL
jgi:hypothetical protein